MSYDGTLDLLDPSDVLANGQVVDLPDPLNAYSDTPVDNVLRERMVSDLFVVGEATLLAYSYLCVVERKDANRICKVCMTLVLLFETGLDVLTHVEVFIVAEVSHLRLAPIRA
jgi:hypothetical protein